MKQKPTKKAIKRQPILLHTCTDYYTLGIFCGLTNLEFYANAGRAALRRNGDPKRLFLRGIREARAGKHTFKDIAIMTHELRERDRDEFDTFIATHAGRGVVDQIKEAIKDVSPDWETAKQKEGCKEVIKRMEKLLVTDELRRME